MTVRSNIVPQLEEHTDYQGIVEELIETAQLFFDGKYTESTAEDALSFIATRNGGTVVVQATDGYVGVDIYCDNSQILSLGIKENGLSTQPEVDCSEY